MQGFRRHRIVPLTIGDYLGSTKLERVAEDNAEVQAPQEAVRERTARLLAIKGTRTVMSIHRELGKLMWEYCGFLCGAAGLRTAHPEIPTLPTRRSSDLNVPGTGAELNQSLEYAGRVADFLELAELMCLDALDREESCGAHFRVEHQTADGEALRDDDEFAYVAAWDYAGEGKPSALRKEPLVFENVHLSQRSYK